MTDESSAMLRPTRETSTSGRAKSWGSTQKLNRVRRNGRTKAQLPELRTDIKEECFGIRVALVRMMLNLTQEALAEMILSTRQSVAAMEKCESIDQLSDGMMFRLYYFTKEISEKRYISEDIIVRCESILKDLRTLILDRTN